MTKKNVTEVAEQLKSFGLGDAEIEINIEKGIKESRYTDDRVAGVIDDTKFKAALDAVIGAVKTTTEVDLAKSASAVAKKVSDAAAGVTVEKVSNEEIKSLLEVSIQKSESVLALLRTAIPGLAEMVGLQVAGVKELEKSQTSQFKGFAETLKSHSVKVVAAGPRSTSVAPPASDRPADDEAENTVEIFKSQLSAKVMAEAQSPDTDGRRRQLIGLTAAVLPRETSVRGLKKLASDLGYTDLLKTAPQA